MLATRSSRLAAFGLLAALLAVSAIQIVAMETLNISGLLNTDEIFRYANILLAALIPVVLIGLGFALARFVVAFVQRVFNGLG
jgi:polyferredoxin